MNKKEVDMINWEIVIQNKEYMLVGFGENHPKLGSDYIYYTTPLQSYSLENNVLRYETQNTIYICPLKYMEAKPYADRNPENIEKMMQQVDYTDNNKLDKIIVASIKISLGMEDDDFMMKIKKLQEIGQRELKIKKEKEEKQLMDMAKQYEDCLYMEVMNPARGDKAAFHINNKTGIINSYLHVGTYSNDSVLYRYYDGEYAIDFRYFPERGGNYMASYCWSESIELIVIKNISEFSIYFNKEKIKPQETKLFYRIEVDELSRRGMF